MAHIWDEKLEGTGYEETWSNGETISTGCTVDEDYATSNVGSPSGWGSQCLRCARDDADESAYVQHIFSGESDGWTRIEVYVISESCTSADGVIMCWVYDNTNSKYLWNLILDEWGNGDLHWQLDVWLNGSTKTTYYSDNVVSTGQRYRIEVKFDITNDVFEWKVDGVSQDSAALSAGHAENMELFRLGIFWSGAVADIAYDLIAIDDADWVGAEATVSDFIPKVIMIT